MCVGRRPRRSTRLKRAGQVPSMSRARTMNKMPSPFVEATHMAADQRGLRRREVVTLCGSCTSQMVASEPVRLPLQRLTRS